MPSARQVYAMDVKGDHLVVACADKNIYIIDLRNNPQA